MSPFCLKLPGLLSALANSALTNRKISSRGDAFEHHRKLRAPIDDISDWLMNADVSGFATPAMMASGYTDVLGPEDSLHFRTSHDYLPHPTTTCLMTAQRHGGYTKS